MVRIHQHVKFEAIQSDCNKNSGQEFSLMPPQTQSKKAQLKKNDQKLKIKTMAKLRKYIRSVI